MSGKIEWIGVRPERRAEVRPVKSVEIDEHSGLAGDHKVAAHRQVTIISREHLEDVRQTLGAETIDPAATRRNIVISGMDFNDLDGVRLRLGSAVIEVTGYCHPCERMNENLGDGGRLAMAHKAGWTAKVLESGVAAIGDPVARVKVEVES